MRPRVPANRRKTNPNPNPVVSLPGRGGAPSEDCALQYSNVLTSISSGFSGMASRVLPLMPVDGPLAFEVIIFVFTAVSLFLQNLHLYRSVWWLPHSYNATAMNFYLIDPNIILFSIIVLSRRVLWTSIKKLLQKSLSKSWLPSFVIVIRSLLTLVILISLLVLAYIIVNRHHLINILYLAYPWVVVFKRKFRQIKEVTTLFTFIGFRCISSCLVLLGNRSWSYLLTLPRSMPIAVVFEYFRTCMAFTTVLLRSLPITPRPCPFSQRWWDKKCKLSKAISMLDSSKSCLTPWLALITLGKNTLGKKKTGFIHCELLSLLVLFLSAFRPMPWTMKLDGCSGMVSWCS